MKTVILRSRTRWGILPILVCLLLTFGSALAAIEGLDTSVLVYDYANLFSQEEAQELSQQAQALKAQYDMDFVLLTITDDEGKGPMAYADDFFDYNGFGVGPDKDGILMLVNMGSRDIWFSTTGHGIAVFSDADIQNLYAVVQPYLSNGAYAAGFSAYLETAAMYIDEYNGYDPYGNAAGSVPDAISGQDSAYQDTYTITHYTTRDIVISNFPVVFLISLGVSVVVLLIMAGIQKSVKHSEPSAAIYGNANVQEITHQSDMFLRTHTSRIARSDDSGSRGGGFSGGSSHTSSSGSSHGGGGGKF